jgi:soluble lytic murein transglycosylase-like protein
MQMNKKMTQLRFMIGAGIVFSLLLLLTLISQMVENHTPSKATQSVPTHQTAAVQPVIVGAPVSLDSPYVGTARQAAVAAGISPDMFVRQIEKESSFNPNVVSPAGAIGIAQFMPGTAASLGINPYDPTQSLYGAARQMSSLSNMYGGDYAKALAAYNAGPGNVNYAVNMGGSNWRAYLPTETQNYISSIMYSQL